MTELGILAPTEDGYRRSDIQLVRVADAVDRAGMALEDIGSMIADGTYSFGWGDLLYAESVRDGDYYGRTVIVAARVTDRIGPSQVVLTADAVAEVTSEDLSFEDMGAAELKGVAEPIRLFRTGVAS